MTPGRKLSPDRNTLDMAHKGNRSHDGRAGQPKDWLPFPSIQLSTDQVQSEDSYD